mgnify:CR=1 FL=1
MPHGDASVDAAGDGAVVDEGIERGVGERVDRVGADQARVLGGVEHGHPDAVLDRVGRVEELQLGQDGRPSAVGHAVQPHERGVADGLAVIGVNAGHEAGIIF